MSSQQQQNDPSSVVSLDGNISNYETSIVIGIVIVTLIVTILMSITMNIWMRYKSTRNIRNTARVSWSPSYRSDETVSVTSMASMASIKSLTKPLPIFNKETTLPVYRRSDTWETYLKMMQSPSKLNDVVHSMKTKTHTPSSSISTKVAHSPSGSIDSINYYELQRQSCLHNDYDYNN